MHMLTAAIFLLLFAPQVERISAEVSLVEKDATQVKFYNGLHSDIRPALKSNQESIYFNILKHMSSSDFKNIPATQLWNITLMLPGNQMLLLKADVEFDLGKKYVIAIYNDSAQHSLLILDLGPMKNETASQEKMILGIDEALIKVTSKLDNLTLYWRSQNCYKCLEQKLMTIRNESLSVKIDTRWPMDINMVTDKGKSVASCNFSYHYVEHGKYEIIVSSVQSQLHCIFLVNEKGDKTYLPIGVMAGIFAGMILFYVIWKRVYWSRYLRKKEYELSHELGKPRNFLGSGNVISSMNTENMSKQFDQSLTKAKKRLKSLDAFRGVAITIMIFVNYQGGHYYFFEHSLWNGLTVADLVFPWFIFIMGTSIDLSQKSLLNQGVRKQTVFKKVLIRSLKLFAIGLFLNNGLDLQKWRIPGVLQRFAISYFVVATISLYMSPSEEKQDSKRRFDWTDHIREIWFFWEQWLIMFCILAVYLIVTFVVHEDGCPRGYLGTGGIGDFGKYQNCTGGAAGFIDRKIFGNNHMYNHPTCERMYKTTVPYDPEGILGSLTSIFLTFLGLHSGRILFMHSSPYGRILRWLCCGALWGVIAIGLAGGTKNEGVIPINKNLWSPSFIFANAGTAYVLLAFMYFVIDVKNWWNGSPFTFAGMNAILLYCGHEIFNGYFPFNFVADPSTHAKILTRSAVGTCLWIAVAFYLYTEKIFFKV